MRILLPPSEAKRSGGDGPPVRLHAPRREVARAVKGLIRADPDAAAAALLLPAAARAEALAANRTVDRSPTMTAIDRYDGVLYRALDVAGLTRSQRGRAEESVVIFSGLLGSVRGGEGVPFYRVPAAATMPGVGHLGRFWRARLELDVDDELVVDLRSTDYLPMWQPPAGAVVVRVLSDTGKAISFTGKQGKGLLARELIRRPPRRVEDVVAAGARIGCRPEFRALTGGRIGLDLLVGREGFEPP
ncbi:MAG: peroxide stress protein YaaA [Acidimicrobiales bacterium]